jgi:hypothetical protein
LIGFHKTPEILEDKTKPEDVIPANLKIGGMMSYDYPSGVRVLISITITGSELSPVIIRNRIPQIAY